MKTYTSIIIILAYVGLINAQSINTMTENVYTNDTVVIRLNNYIGDIQWQKSIDNINWTDIENANADTLLFIANQTAFIRASVAVGACEPFISDISEIVVTPEQNYDSILIDIDGNTYKTIRIGEQVWMAENLRVTHYADGTQIPKVVDNTEWGNLGDNNTDKGYCWHDNDSSR